MAAMPVPPLTPLGTSGVIDVTIRGLRNDHGVVRLVLCPAASGFPDCKHAGMPQIAAITNRQATASFRNLAAGEYAIAAYHDENNNGQLDTFLGIPREGIGFSRNPSLRPRAPHFSECNFSLSGTFSTIIQIKYLL